MKTFRDFPIRSPCETCGIEKWNECYRKAMACQKLWDWLAQRGDWVTAQNEEVKSGV